MKTTKDYHCLYLKCDVLLLADIDSLMYETKTEYFYEDFSSNKERSNFRNYSTKSKYCNNPNNWVIGKMKDETGCVVIEKFVGLNPKICSFLVDNNKHKKAKGMNKNAVAK